MIAGANTNVIVPTFSVKKVKESFIMAVAIHWVALAHSVSGFVYKLVTSTAKWEDLAHTMPMLLTGL